LARFDDRVLLVTGAASGIGRACATRLASEGGTVGCLDLDLEGCQDTARSIRDAGGRARAYRVDVSEPSSVEEVVSLACSELGRPVGLANVAGIGKFAHTVEQPVEEWDRIIDVNLKGTFLMCRAVLPHLLGGGGRIVNVASSAGLVGQPYSAAYCASKGGVVLLTKALALEHIERGVTVNAVAPGGVDTPLLSQFGFPEGASERLLATMMSPMGFAQPEEVAGMIAFLLSDEARFMTGAVVPFDGGLTI